MKHLNKIIGWMMVACAGLALATSCNKEGTPDDNNIPDFTMQSLAGTSWRGYYEDVLHHNGSHQMLFTWTLDFNDEGTGMVMMEMTSPVAEDIVEEFDLTYTYDGANSGKLKYMGYMYEYTSDFIVDPLNHSLDVNLRMHFLLSEDDTVGTVFGGRTTLYQVAN